MRNAEQKPTQNNFSRFHHKIEFWKLYRIPIVHLLRHVTIYAEGMVQGYGSFFHTFWKTNSTKRSELFETKGIKLQYLRQPGYQ